MERERTFVMVKPDGIQRGLAGTIISRIEQKGLKLVALKMMRIDKALAEKHYAVHHGKPFYVWEGEHVVSIVRKLVGATCPDNAEPGSIRGDYVISTTLNTIHASDSKETAAFEIHLFFKDEEIQDYTLCLESWLYFPA
jgi:nucleoside-diphosphate kinase